LNINGTYAVWDQDKYSADDEMGEAIVDLNSVFASGNLDEEHEVVVPLQNVKKGSLVLGLSFVSLK
jgi:hypothetical protein